MSNEVMEQDLRAPEFRHGKPEEYERRSDGKIVRKDRFKTGMQNIASIVFGARHEYEIPEVVDAVRGLAGMQLRDAINDTKDVYHSEPKAIEALDYLNNLINSAKAKP